MRIPAFFMMLLFVGLSLQSCDPCRKLDCLNGGECVDGNCECQPGYTGETCNQEVREKFIAQFDCSEICTTTNTPPNVGIIEGANINEIQLYGLYRFGTGVTAVVNENTFTIPSQPFGNSFISGSGELNSTTLTINYVISGNGNYDECTVVGEKIF